MIFIILCMMMVTLIPITLKEAYTLKIPICTKDQLRRFNYTDRETRDKTQLAITYDFDDKYLRTEDYRTGKSTRIFERTSQEIRIMAYCKEQSEIVQIHEFCEMKSADRFRHFYTIDKCDETLENWLLQHLVTATLVYETLLYLTLLMMKTNALGVYYLNPDMNSIRMCDSRIKLSNMSLAKLVTDLKADHSELFDEVRNLAVIFEKVTKIMKFNDKGLDSLIDRMKNIGIFTRYNTRPDITLKQVFDELEYLKDTFEKRNLPSVEDNHFPEYLFGVLLFSQQNKIDYFAEWKNYLRELLRSFPFFYTSTEIKETSLLKRWL